MNRVALLIALGYLGLALVAGVIYVSSVAKFVDYSETIFRFEAPGQVRVASANFSQDPGTANWTVRVTWRFVNDGRLPIILQSFLFELYVDNRSDPTPWYVGSKLALEFHRTGSFFLDRTTGPRIEPGGYHEWTWGVNATAPDASRIVRDPGTGKVWIVLTDLRTVFFVADVESRQELAPPDVYMGV
ncbi:MAG TPA: hypothetical protein VI915_04465 [Thermoplasmata archaeon]|nr:hypothetical protein [Thermoplasmata archaeon]